MTDIKFSLHREGWGTETLADNVDEAEIIKAISVIADELIQRKSCQVLDDNYVMSLPNGLKLVDYKILEWLKTRIEDDAFLELAKGVFQRDLFNAVIDSFGAKYSK